MCSVVRVGALIGPKKTRNGVFKASSKEPNWVVVFLNVNAESCDGFDIDQAGILKDDGHLFRLQNIVNHRFPEMTNLHFFKSCRKSAFD